MGVQHLDRQIVTDLNVALDEASVHGVRWQPGVGVVRLLLCVLALPEQGPPDPDRRRILTLVGVDTLRVLLRRDRLGSIDYGPPMQLAGQQGLDAFLSSLSFSDAMYGGRALDDPSTIDDWPVRQSLVVPLGAPERAHSLYWFADCGREEPGGVVLYRLEGFAHFTTLTVHRADGGEQRIREFADDGLRWWAARRADDPRARARAPRELTGPPWDTWTP